MNSGGGGGSGSNDMVTQEDTIFVSGMNVETTEEEIATHFGAIGVIKVNAWKNYIFFSEESPFL
jgi:RNA-binding protein FUS